MSDEQGPGRSRADADLEREIREQRKFTLAEAIGRLAGPGAMKGASPITRKRQAEMAVEAWLTSHFVDSSGALRVVLLRRIKGSEQLLKNYDRPLAVLAEYCQQTLVSDYSVRELVREVDVEWGRILGERPHFDKEGIPPEPDDAYTVESVRNTLTRLVEQLKAAEI